MPWVCGAGLLLTELCLCSVRTLLRSRHFPPVPETIITASALWRSCYSPIIDPAQTMPRAAACHSFLIPGHALLIDSGRQVGDITQ